ncbi:MAG: hypothetical protein WCK32_04305 [Chlorobiaceae bacterium]
MEYTFYGDLLGIGSAYRLGASTAKDKLTAFYDETFRVLDAFDEVEMFSDSLFVKGDDAAHAVVQISKVFANLLDKGLLLRGAMVKGKLSFEPLITKKNFQTRLPDDDTLARAAGLEKMQKGARFLIESALANDLLYDVPDWKSHDGYLRSIFAAPADSFLRRICPTPDSSSYEYLYYWSSDIHPEKYDTLRKNLKDILPMCDKASREQYEETIALIERCRHRNKITMDRLS